MATVKIPAWMSAWANGWSNLSEPAQLEALVAVDTVYEDVAFGDVVKGKPAFQQLLGIAYRGIPDFRIELFGGCEQGATAATEYTISGTQRGDLPYLKASGKPFRIRASSIFEIADGKIRRETRYYNVAHFLAQLGGLDASVLSKLGTEASRPGG